MALSRASKGFTLIELSIVLVVIGLVVGGVMAGQSLVHAAHLRKTGEEYRKYEIAFHTFQEKYTCLPGDCEYMTQFMPGGCVNPAIGNMTCNGNGNGMIEAYETRYVCQHLGFAGLIPSGCIGGFNDVAGTVQGVQAGVNALPTSYANHNLLELTYSHSGVWVPYSAPIREGNYLATFSNSPAGYYYPISVASSISIVVDDARRIDGKIDDGLPFSGRLIQFDYACASDIPTNTYSGAYFVAGAQNCYNLYQIN